MDRNADFQQEPTFRDLVSLIRRGLVFALAVAIGAAAVTYILTKHVAPSYEATATVLASQPDNTLQRFGVSLVTAPSLDITTYQAAATSNPVLVAAMKSLGVKNPGENQVETLLKTVKVRIDSSRQSNLLHIDVKSGTRETAAKTANAIANALLSWDKQRATQNLDKIVEALRGQIASLDALIVQARAAKTPDQGEISGLESLRAQQSLQLNSARALENSAVGNLEILEPAVRPLTQLSPRPKQDASLAFVLGVILVYGVLLLRDVLDMRFRDIEDLVRTCGVPVLAEFPRSTNGSRHLPREAANYLRTNILFATNSEHPKILLITSAGSGEGKTSVAMSLAESFARNDSRTLLVDADLRKPTINAEYDVSSHANTALRSLLDAPSLPYEPAVVGLEDAELHIIPSFLPEPSPTELLGFGFAKLLRRFADQYDVIIIDSAPVLPVADALTIAPHCTGVVFSVSLPTADRRNARAALDLLERIGVRILGVVATNLVSARNGRGEHGYRYGYGYGYGYGHAPNSAGESKPKPPHDVAVERRT